MEPKPKLRFLSSFAARFASLSPSPPNRPSKEVKGDDSITREGSKSSPTVNQTIILTEEETFMLREIFWFSTSTERTLDDFVTPCQIDLSAWYLHTDFVPNFHFFVYYHLVTQRSKACLQSVRSAPAPICRAEVRSETLVNAVFGLPVPPFQQKLRSPQPCARLPDGSRRFPGDRRAHFGGAPV
eukprot:29731-Hanusia_phi.AAC.6